MSLTTGATLQGSKYVIQARLHQSDFGVSYQATHTLLDQPVVLQTLNPVVRQRTDFAAVRQQFIEGVRSLSYRETVRVLDCFEEEGLPVVVLQPIAGQEPLQLSDWLQLAPEPLPERAETASANASPEAVPQAGEPSMEQATEQTSDKASAPKANGASDVLPVLPAPESAPVASSRQTTQATAPVAPKLPLLPSLPTPKDRTRDLVEPSSERKLPMALVVTALAGLGLGAGTGLALRYQPSPQPGETGVNSSRSAPSLFSREQSFPSQGDWPVEEVPNLFPAEPKVEEPVYRSAPIPDYYTAPYYSPPPVQPLEVKPYTPPPSPDSIYDSQPLPDLAPDPAAPIEPLPKADAPLLPPKEDAINTAPPAASEPAPAAVPPLEPIAPASPAQLPKGLPPIISQ